MLWELSVPCREWRWRRVVAKLGWMPFDGCRGRLGALLDAAAHPTILAHVGRWESASRRGGPQHLDWGCQAASDGGTSCHDDGRMAPSFRRTRLLHRQKCAPRPVPNDMCPSNHWTRRILLLAAMAMLVMVTLFNSNLQQSLLLNRLPDFQRQMASGNA